MSRNYIDLRTVFAVEWSYFDNFSRVVGSHVIEDEHAIGYDIQGLEPGNCYFVRVRAGNDHGFGSPATSTPSGATPSSEYHSGTKAATVFASLYHDGHNHDGHKP